MMFSEIYNPSPMMFSDGNSTSSTPIQLALDEYGNYMELINIYCDDRPYLYDEATKVKATDFLTNAQYKLLRKKREQELINQSQQKK